MKININKLIIRTKGGADFLTELAALVEQYGAEPLPHKEETMDSGLFWHPDYKELAEAIPHVATALRKEGFSEGLIRAALLSICGVRVDDPLVRHLMRFV